MSKMPPKDDLDSMRKKLANAPGTRIISDKAPQIDLIKRDICSQFIIYLRVNKLNKRQLAQRLEISEANVSKITRYHFDEFTVDRLIRYLDNLGIKYKFQLVA